MSCRSLLYTVLPSTATVEAGGVVPVGVITRRFGPAIRVDGNAITLLEPGYYEISVSLVVQPDAATAISARVLENGVALSGAVATATPTAADADTLLTIPAAVSRVYNGTQKALTVELSAAADVTSAVVTVKKV